jgi:uncharacterized protein (DUF1778 family)
MAAWPKGVGKMSSVEERGRITARVPQAVQDKLMEAAALTGSTLNQFLVQSALEKAEQIIDREKTIGLTAKDAAMLIELLENPVKPNAALRKAIRSYKTISRCGRAGARRYVAR